MTFFCHQRVFAIHVGNESLLFHVFFECVLGSSSEALVNEVLEYHSVFAVYRLQFQSLKGITSSTLGCKHFHDD